MFLKYSLVRATTVCLALLALSACQDEENPLLSTSAGKLAAIDAGTKSITEIQVNPYKTILSKLETKCEDTRSGIADTAVRATELFKSKKGIEVSNLSVMQMIDESIPAGTKMNCVEIISAIILLS